MSTCFRSSASSTTELPVRAVRLNEAHAGALSELLQVLSCGEESAALTFDHLGGACPESAASSSLAGIAADEREHERLLNGLRSSLPQPAEDRFLDAAMRRFFMRLAHRDVAVHLVRIVAIDSAMCRILGELRSSNRPLAADPWVTAILERIHRDEARHVAIASRCARPLLKAVRGREIALDAREQLIEVLRLRGDSFDSLGVEPDELFARLRALPRSAQES